MLVDGIVQNLEDAVVQATLIGIANVHAGPLPDRLESLQFVDLRRAILLATRGVLFFGNIGVVEGNDRFCGWFFGHGKVL
jgi:hypothetical protein